MRDSADIAGWESPRVLAVFQDLAPCETRAARACYAPVYRPADRTCEGFSVRRL